MPTLVEKIQAVHAALKKAGLRHAFGGAIALAYCTEEPRGTRDLDVNVFVPAKRAQTVIDVLPPQVQTTPLQLKQLTGTGQTRLWWEQTPLDLFLNNLPLHDETAREIRWVAFAGGEIPVLSCASLVLFKAFFDRTQDWADIEAVAAVDTASIATASERIAALLGEDSEPVKRLRRLAG